MENTAKNFILQLGSLVALYISVISLILLLTNVITLSFPDQSQFPWEVESASSAIRGAIAALVVFFPAYLVVTRIVNTARRNELSSYTTLTRWLLYISLLVGGGVLLGDLVSIVNSFLNGELTVRFLLKSLTVFVVVGTAFTYYVLDARKYWQTHEKASTYWGSIVTVLVAGALTLGFLNIETPAQVRERSIDTRVVSDLINIESTIGDYVTVHNALPATLQEAYGALTIPQAPEGRSAYTYTTTGDTTFKLCSSFTSASSQSTATPYPDTENSSSSWEHGAGPWCFEHAIAKAPVFKG